MNRQTVVVDYDCMTAAGLDLENTWDVLVKNGSGIDRISRYDPRLDGSRKIAGIEYAGEIPATHVELAGSQARHRQWPEPAHHAVGIVCDRILDRLQFETSQHDPERIGLFGATALTSQLAQDALNATGETQSKFILNQCHNVPLALVASRYGLQGPSFSIGSACASSCHALYLASQLLQAGLLDCALVAGFEFPVSPVNVRGLTWLGALFINDREDDRASAEPALASRPFSNDRRGFVLAEGVGVTLLAESAYCSKMGWPRKGYLRGGHTNSDGGHLTRMSSETIARCMQTALRTARLDSEIGCVNVHATSTPIGDKKELMALRQVLGDKLKSTPLVANKSQLGHSVGACAIIGLMLAMEGMRESIILPTLNYEPDPELPQASITTTAAEHDHTSTLINSFGFGGTNACLVVSL